MGDCNDKRKREDDSSDSERVDSPELKILRVDSSVSDDNSSVSDDNSSVSKLTRTDSVPDSVQDDIFNILDDADNVPERDSVQGLDSVIKSFEDEINGSSSDPTQIPESGELEPNLGYLLEASDDELGLPPTAGSGEEPGRVDPNIVAMNGFMGFDDDFPSYDAFEFGFTAESDGGAGGFVTLDGLFDYAEPSADVLWRSESLQAM